jgi:hypothetical protein
MNVKGIALPLRDFASEDDSLFLRRKHFSSSLRADPAHRPITPAALDYLLNGPQVARTGNLTHNIDRGVAAEMRNRASQVLVQRITALLADLAGLATVTRIERASFHSLSMPYSHLTILHPIVLGRNTIIDSV